MTRLLHCGEGTDAGHRSLPRDRPRSAWEDADPLDPDDDVVEVIERMKNTVQLRSGERRTFHTRVGAEDMSAENIADNIDVIVRRLRQHSRRVPSTLTGSS